MTTLQATPKIGDKIYVPSTMSFDKSERAIRGGLGIISEISNLYGTPFIRLEEAPDYSFNFAILSEDQDRLKKEFGSKAARFETDTDAKKRSKQDAQEYLDEALDSVSNLTNLVGLFDEGEQQSLKVMKLALTRLKTKISAAKK